MNVHPINDNLPLVSCVIIFLNSEQYLGEAIDSVLAQSYANWELWLVDDGSTDGSTAVAQRYARNHPERVYYLAHEGHTNRGKNAARNLGVAHARGKYVALLDSDDLWLPEKLTEQVALLEQYPTAGMLYGRTQLWFSWHGDGSEQEKDALVDLGVVPNRLIQPPELFLCLLAGESQTPTTCNAILRTAVFHEIGGFDESYHDIMEDQAFFAKVELVYPVYVADNVWAKYRKHATSSLTQFFAACATDRTLRDATELRLFQWIAQYLRREQIRDERVWRALRAQMRPRQRRLRLLRLPLGNFLLNGYLGIKFWIWIPLKKMVCRE